MKEQPAPFLLEWPPLLEAIRGLVNDEAVYLVGGAVRDAILRRSIHDLDFATEQDGRRLAKRIADKLGGAYYPLDAERGVGRAIIKQGDEPFVIDVARFRGGTLSDDLAGRDFTINAMAVDLNGDLQSIIDPLGGLSDLQKKRLRRCGPNSIPDDPVRALRAVRQSVVLGLQIEPETRADIRNFGPQIANASVERVRDEFMTMLGGPRPHVALRTLDALGLLTIIIPEVDPMRGVTQSPPHVYEVWEHTLYVIEKLYGVIMTISPARTEESAADGAYGMIVYLLDRYRKQLQARLDEPLPNGRNMQALLMLAALLHDCAKPMTRTVDENGHIHFYKHEIYGADIALQRAIALRLSSEEAQHLAAIVRNHMRIIQLEGTGELSKRTIYRFWKGTGAIGVDVCILTQADYLATYGVTLVLQDWIAYLQLIGSLLEAYFNERDTAVAPPPLVTGRDLMDKLPIEQGPTIGRLLNALGEAQVVGEISTVDQALELAKTLLNTPEGNEDNLV
jgi:tRNA nucleotidyltransferase/poly(A) polymerase